MKTVAQWMVTFDGLNSLDAARAIFEHMSRRSSVFVEQSEREQDIASALEAFALVVFKRAVKS